MRTITDVLLEDEPLSLLLKNNKTAEAAEYLFKQQLQNRKDINLRYAGLSDLLKKHLDFGRFTINIQFNPDRIISTGAPVDAKTVQERNCFLCFKNIPEEQKAVQFDDYLLLVNPFPIFPEHFTITHKEHIPQEIKSSFEDLLLISKKLSPYITLFYNGPQCGASAPDHLHFQGGTKGRLPLENEISFLEREFGEIIKRGSTILSAVDDGLRKMIVLKGGKQEEIVKIFFQFYNIYSDFFPGNEEPLMNIIAIYDESEWTIIILLREKHRPDIFFTEGENNFFVSPAAADLSGIFVTPLKKDFDKGNKELIEEVFKEVSFDSKKFAALKKKLKENF